MSSPHTERPVPSLPAKVWGFLGRHGPTFAPFGAALFIIASYVAFYVAFANCAYPWAGCKPAEVRELLREGGWCPADPAVAAQPAQSPPTQAQPTPSPTPVVAFKTEGGGAVPQVTVQVTLPPPPPAAPSATPTEAERKAAVYTARLSWPEGHGLNVTGSLKTLWPKLAAIVAPLLVGSLGELFKGLSSIHQ